MRIKMPDISGAGEEIVLTAWHVKECDQIKQDDDLLEVVTDKAAFDLPVPCSGTVTKLFKKIGEKINVGDVIADIKEDNHLPNIN